MNKCISYLVELKWNKNTPFFYNSCSCLSLHFSSKQLNIVKERTDFFHFRGLLMPRCRSPPFLSEKQIDKKEMEETLWQRVLPLCQRAKGKSQ